MEPRTVAFSALPSVELSVSVIGKRTGCNVRFGPFVCQQILCTIQIENINENGISPCAFYFDGAVEKMTIARLGGPELR